MAEQVLFHELLDSSDDEIFFNIGHLLNADSSEDEEDAVQYLLLESAVTKTKRNCIVQYVENVVDNYSDNEFVTHFRLKRDVVEELTANYADSEIYKSLLSGHGLPPISPSKHMLAFLWFAGHQTASFRDVSDRFDISLFTLYGIITRVSKFISSLASTVVVWPSAEEKAATEFHYRTIKGFPNIIGSIDGSHIKIDKPTNDHNDYINRHGTHSIILQGTCNHNYKFIDVFVGYPGSVHDARVFKNSPVYERLNHLCEGGYLLGDSAYPCLQHCLVPYRDNGHLTNVQRNFNKTLSSCRVDIEHAFGILKQRFRQLYHLKLRGHRRICHFIRACCVLHNIASLDDLEFLGDPIQEHAVNERALDADQERGNDLRDEVARQLYLRE